MKRDYWMVVYRVRTFPLAFRFCESQKEAEGLVKQFRTEGVYAACWEL